MAVIHQAGLGAVYGFQEASYCTIEGTLGNFFPIPAIWENALNAELEEPVEDPGHIGQRLDQSALGVLMPKRARYPLIVPMETFATKATNGVQAPLHWAGRMFHSALGGIYRSTGTTISGSGSTTTVLNVNDASTHRAGGAIGILNPTSGLLEMREIASVNVAATPDTITLKMALSFTPANAAVVLGASTCFLHNNPDGADPSFLQVLMFGYNQYDRWQLPGGTLQSLRLLNMQPGGFPRAEFGLQFPSWLVADGTNGTVNSIGTTLGLVTYADVVANTIRDSDARLRAYGSSALAASTLVQATELSIDPSIEYEMLPSPNGPFSSNVRSARRRDTRPTSACRVTFTEPAEDNQKYDAYHSARTQLAFTQQVGMSATRGGFLVSVPCMQTAAPPRRRDLGAVRGINVQLSSMLDAETTAAAGASAADVALATAAFRTHWI